MCLWNMDAPGGNQDQIWQKSLSPIFWPPPPVLGTFYLSIINLYIIQGKF